MLQSLERRLIVTARHLSQKLKRSLSALSASSTVLPTLLRHTVNEALKTSTDLYNMFASTVCALALETELLYAW